MGTCKRKYGGVNVEVERIVKAYMGLTCQPGFHTEVLKRLLNLCIRERGCLCFSERDIFLLFGPIYILIPFHGLKSLEEFVEKASLCSVFLLCRRLYIHSMV